MKQLPKSVKRYFTNWQVPMAANSVPILIFILGVLFRRDWIINFSLIVFFLNVLGTIASSVVQVFQGKWYYIFPQLAVSGFLIYYLGIIFTYSPPDYYGAHKEIPDNIDFSRPLDSVPTIKTYELHDLVVIGSESQPGMYSYHTSYSPTEPGFFYIQAFEVTSNDQLSKDQMAYRSRVRVKDPKQKEIRQGEFTIYEGDWGDEYGSRIELWYQPAEKPSYKVEEQHFIIEGWQR